MRVCTKIGNTLTHVQKQNFSNMLFNSSANPIKERVMSTPTWPVPYYQRLMKAYPVRGTENIIQNKKPSTWHWWISTLTTPTGTLLNRFWTRLWRADKSWSTQRRTSRQAVFLLIFTAYLIRKNDCETMVRSYVDDCGQFLDIANRENVRILAGKTLIWLIIEWINYFLLIFFSTHIEFHILLEFIQFKSSQ